MSFPDASPFDRIEAAQEYLTLLSVTVAENQQRVEAEIMALADQGNQRGLEVLTLVAYNLEKLEKHLKAGRLMLNNLGKLRRLLLKECISDGANFEKISQCSVLETGKQSGLEDGATSTRRQSPDGLCPLGRPKEFSVSG